MDDSFSDSWTSRTVDEKDVELDIRPLASKDGLLIKIQPQLEPTTKDRTPVDIVLVIDVSNRMQTEAPAPADENQVAERFGFTVLDLVKHACVTIVETLRESDRLGIVIFAGTAQVLQPLTVQDTSDTGPSAKRLSVTFLRGLRILSNMSGSTNMWDGVCKGLELFQTGQDGTYRVPALMLVTNCKPDYVEQQGWVPKLKSMRPLPAPIHTFGFGYDVRSDLLKSISELSGGHYAFMPDPSMIGTVLIHAMANIQSTAATEACLTIKGDHLKLASPFLSTALLRETPSSTPDPNKSTIYSINISLGSIQFGQSRDIYLAYERHPPEDCIIEAKLTFCDLSGTHRQVDTKRRAGSLVNLPPAEVAYHVSRAQICQFISSLFPIDTFTGQIRHQLDLARSTLPLLKRDMAARLFADDADCASLVADLEGAPPRGQISLALGSPGNQMRWGGHYLLGLLDAHASQVCSSHKDQGPLRYGRDSPVFRRCRDALDAAFDYVDATEPSIDVDAVLPPVAPPFAPQRAYRDSTAGSFGSVPEIARARSWCDNVDHYMTLGSRFNQSSIPCFAGLTMVRLAGGSGGVVPISWLRAGISVATPVGPRAVQRVLRTRVRDEVMVRLPGGVVVTPWHPVKMGGDGAEWTFPATTAASTAITYSGFTYSLLLLEADSSSQDGKKDRVAAAEQHAFCVGSGGTWAAALGHRIVQGGDARAHEFFGDRDACIDALAILPALEGGLATSAGVLRSATTGRVVGFQVPGDGV
ncbi:uncharacterized protein PpBr36_10164 [Pyricularia pennisetigena]|uniref:uncharacterized protein n=1 Tax=Pyricularia pennisetigena TaxID=1578925 RepID=UPI00115427D4|nr:uncharacterized protein PpBr36_10164 [Pyricularia pennisetigena]TLS21380.1 hypothetical protein PpBr36_10164 [Pyricularia pennisetigena]